ncbi:MULTISPECIES: Imm47 family immunity protein [Streptococcus]|uniref:Group-specific protein n=2 Tax=Streptococcus TaxID=1301 RepID=A0A7H9FIM0_STROR|nr:MULTISPECIES: Imm47 family immunity protein [Streptococcus]EIC77130.1 hypothetical protein HMPREF1114_1744 [Streptococcus oralis SK100]KZX08782.1 group-specific protein [Streptococcus oralis]QLL98207.1 group-specific protein [Streptococcus oralis subsp. oralis]RRN46997.1 group-specific protein [Streptococcus halitosis]
MGNKLLMPGMSFGHVSSVALEDLKRGLLSVNDERECVLLIAEILKKGDFTVKNLLIDLMNQTKDEAVLNLCIRLFCSVCTHDDLKKVENFHFLSSASEFAIFTFVGGAVETMSYEVVPYLLTLWEEWEDTETEVEYATQDALDSFLNYRSIIEENARLEEVGSLYFDVIKNKNLDCYYYKTLQVFPGLFTQEIMTALYIATQKEQKYHLYLQASLLSIYTGKQVPVDTNTLISKNEIDLMVGYIDDLSDKDWTEGMKYFYGHPVEELVK